MTKIKISAVSYTNTIPFIYGIENSEIINHIELSKDIPSTCAKKLLSNKVDIGLVPVAVMPKLKHPEIITNYCIGASGPVRSVILACYKPLDEIKTILLDYHSKSSVMLTRILAKHYWKINVKWTDTVDGFENTINTDEAAVIIGDKAMAVENKFPYVYDLAEEWIRFTNLPFVFAAWITNKALGSTFKTEFNHALKFGLNNIDAAIETNSLVNLPSHIDAKKYLTENIDFEFDDKKYSGLKLFLKYASEFQ